MASSAGEKGGVRASLRRRRLVARSFDVAGGHVGVFEAGGAAADGAGDGDDELGAGGFGFEVGAGWRRTCRGRLGDAGAVAEVEEDEVAVVAAAVDPAHEGYCFAGFVRVRRSPHMWVRVRVPRKSSCMIASSMREAGTASYLGLEDA